INTFSTGPTRDFGATDSGVFNGFRVTNNFAVCQGDTPTHVITCPNATVTTRANQLITAGSFGTRYTSAATGSVSLATIVNPVGILNTVSVRDFRLTTHGDFTHTNTESFYAQDDWKASKNLQFN